MSLRDSGETPPRASVEFTTINEMTIMKKDYLAIIRIGGGSSYGRDASIFDAVESAIRICLLDWSRYYELEGRTLSVQVLDVSGRTDLGWDDQGVYCTDTGDTVEPLKFVTVQLPELTGRMKITGPKYLTQAGHEVAKACSQVAA